MSDVKTMQLHYTSDCMKCGGRVMENKEGKEFTCECAYPEDCQVKKLAEPVSDWISVGDRLPEFGQAVLITDGLTVAAAHADTHFYKDDRVYWDFLGIHTVDGEWIFNENNITHWQPLPPLPE